VNERLLVDTNVWLAAADRRSVHHQECTQLIVANAGRVSSPVPVLAESSWLILDRLGPEPHRLFLEAIVEGAIAAIDLTGGDWRRATALCAQYADLRLDLMDASIVAIAERLEITIIATFNHRDFTVVRPAHTEAFELIPANTTR